MDGTNKGFDVFATVRPFISQPFDESRVPVRTLPLLRFVIAVDNMVEACWDDSDFEKARAYAKRLLSGEQPPAILVSGSIIYDGYHRIWATRESGYRYISAVDVKDVYRAMPCYPD